MSRLRVKNSASDDRRLRIGKKKQSSSTHSPVITSEKFIVCEDRDGGRFYAMKTDGDFTRLCVPNSDGILIVTDQLVCATDFKEAHDMNATPVFERGTLKHFDTRTEFEKAATVVQDDMKQVIDFKDIKLDGLASTFSTLTPADRDGDVIGDNAFDKTIRQFLKNPVMLIDHQNSVNNIAGSFKKLRSSQRGLEVEAEVSNAPELRKIRFLIGEGHLKAFSIGGLFKFSDNNPRLVEEIELFEISLVAVPANPDALFEARSVSVEDAKTAFKRMKLNYK
jgi:HK97 family phage prohead protease